MTDAPAPAAATPSKPFLRWAGGKRRLLKWLVPALPREFNRYYEPFVGGGALLFALESLVPGTRCVLGDSNPELALTYRMVRDQNPELQERLRSLAVRCDLEEYLQIRAQDPAGLSDVDRAARLVYLNKTCFNGLWRVDRHGRFNVPWGKLVSPNVCDSVVLDAAQRRLQGSEIHNGSFIDTVSTAERGDLVYFDPPYVPLTATASFAGYAAGGFNLSEHEKLAALCGQLVRRGVHVMLSNSDTPATRELFADCGLVLHAVRAPRSIAAKGDRRQDVGELLGVSWPLDQARDRESLPFG